MSTLSSSRYPFAWRLLHWLSAIVILWAVFSGFFILIVRPAEHIIHWIADFNVAVTLLFVPVFAVRILIAASMTKPSTPDLDAQQQALANKGHLMLYVVVCAVLTSGVLMMDRGMSVFGWFEIAPLLKDEALTSAFFTLHRYANIMLTLLLVAHIAAVVKHQRHGVPLMRKMI